MYLCRVGVIKADGHVAAIELGNMVVQQRGLGVANVQVA